MTVQVTIVAKLLVPERELMRLKITFGKDIVKNVLDLLIWIIKLKIACVCLQ